MSFFLVGGGYDETPEEAVEHNLDDAYDAFVAEARPFGPSARIGVVVSGSSPLANRQAELLAGIVTSRWPEAQILTIHLSGATGTLPEGLDTLGGIIVGGGDVADYLAGLGPAADQLSRLVRGGAPWLGFSAGAMVTAVTAVQGGWRLQGRQIAPEPVGGQDEGTEELSLVQGLGLVSITSVAHNDTCSADGLLISALDAGLIGSAVAIDEDTCLVVHHSSGRTRVLGAGLVRWFSKVSDGVVVRSERSPHKELPPAPPAPRFEGLARVAAATRAARAERGQ